MWRVASGRRPSNPCILITTPGSRKCSASLSRERPHENICLAHVMGCDEVLYWLSLAYRNPPPLSRLGTGSGKPTGGVVIANYVSVGNFDECVKYYEEMSRNDCQPDVDTCAKIICGLIKARKVADALEMFDEMLRKGIIPTTGMVTSFIEPLCNYGPPYAAMIIYKNARKQGCRISLNAYKLLLMRLSRFGKCGMLVKLWDEIQESGYSADIEVYEYVVNGLCNNGQLEAAVCVMEEALRKGFCPSRLMYSKLNKKLMAFNKVDRAYKLFLKVKQARVNENARRYWRRNGWHF